MTQNIRLVFDIQGQDWIAYKVVRMPILPIGSMIYLVGDDEDDNTPGVVKTYAMDFKGNIELLLDLDELHQSEHWKQQLSDNGWFVVSIEEYDRRRRL